MKVFVVTLTGEIERVHTQDVLRYSDMIVVSEQDEEPYEDSCIIRACVEINVGLSIPRRLYKWVDVNANVVTFSAPLPQGIAERCKVELWHADQKLNRFQSSANQAIALTSADDLQLQFKPML